MRSNLELGNVLPNTHSCNSGWDLLERGGGRHLEILNATITGTGTVNTNVLKVTGTVQVISQWAIITEVTTLTNMTNVYADVWDGTNSVPLTKTTTCTLSNAPVGTYFSKDLISTEPYTVNMADQCRMSEMPTKNFSYPFIVTANNGSTTYIRFNYTTTDNPINFKMSVYFNWLPVDGGTLTQV